MTMKQFVVVPAGKAIRADHMFRFLHERKLVSDFNAWRSANRKLLPQSASDSSGMIAVKPDFLREIEGVLEDLGACSTSDCPECNSALSRLRHALQGGQDV